MKNNTPPPDDLAKLFGFLPKEELTEEQKAGKALLELVKRYGSRLTEYPKCRYRI